MKKNKSGSAFGMTVLVSAILLIAGIALFWPILQGIYNTITGGGNSVSCTLSLIQGKGTAKCPVQEVKITNNGAELNGKSFIAKSDNSKQMANEAFANMLKQCMGSGGGYNSNAFSRDDFVSDNAVCLECFKVKIDNSVGKIDGLLYYLRDTKDPSSISGDTYLKGLTKNPDHLRAYMEYGAAKELAPSVSTYAFNPGQDYSIFFLGIKKGETSHIWYKVKAGTQLDFLKAIFSNNDAYFAYIVESNKLGEICDRKVN